MLSNGSRHVHIKLANGVAEATIVTFADRKLRFCGGTLKVITEDDCNDRTIFSFVFDQFQKPIRFDFTVPDSTLDGSFMVNLNELAPVGHSDALCLDLAEKGEPTSFPGAWHLLGFLFSSQTRKFIYEPECEDLLAQHAVAYERSAKSTAVQAWLSFCFAARTARTVLHCLWIEWRLLILAVAGLFLPSRAASVLRELLAID